MGARIGGKNFDIILGDLAVHIDTATLTITDNTGVAKTGGVPNGHVDGDVEASGDMEVDALNLSIIMEAAKAAGSFRALPPFDCLFNATTADGEELRVEAYGCKFKLESLLNITASGGELHKTKLQFMVTSPDFIRINGVPYLDASEIKDLVSLESV